jgi:hypothetical protein
VFPDAARSLADGAALVLGRDEDAPHLTAGDLTELTSDLQTLVRRTLAPLDAATRADVLERFASMLNVVSVAERRELAERLFEVREALRERLPALVMSPSTTCALHVDRLLAIDERSFYIEGWIDQEGVSVVRLRAVSPEGRGVELTERILRYHRPDVAEYLASHGKDVQDTPGFVCFFELDAPSLRPDGWIVEVESNDGVALEVAAPPVLTDPLQARDAIFQGPPIEKVPNERLMSDHLLPAVTRIQRRLHAGARAESAVQLGTPPTSPDESIVVPLMGQLGLLEIQLSQFADDPELRETDLIYVLESPEAEDALQHAADIFPIYRVPFRVAVPEESLGFAGAANAGAEIARGRLLVLMEPDVIPSRAGWLSDLRSFYDATPSIGALGPKLLYEDDSIQHAGLHFYRRSGSRVWTRATYFKGMHRLLAAANVPRVVPAVSRACLVIDRALYGKVGGLPGLYVEEAYEDTDLCLQLSEQGLETWYLPEVELYHPELPSVPNGRQALERYDAWLHTHRWGERV